MATKTDSVEEILRQILEKMGMADDNLMAAVAEKMTAKKQLPRFEKYVDTLNELIASNNPLVIGSSLNERYAQFVELVDHAERLWRDAKTLFSSGSYPTAIYLSILCIEEIGKIGIVRFQITSEKSTSSGDASVKDRHQRRGNPFYSHRQKHLLAAGAGALISSRLDRILGIDTVINFLDDIESGKIEQLRQECVYVERDGKNLHLPYKSIGMEQARFYVVLAGELLAEILGFEPGQWARLLAMVRKFEDDVGMNSE